MIMAVPSLDDRDLRPAARRVAVTGFGCVSALGHDAETTWSRLIAAEEEVTPLTIFPVDGCRVQQAAQVKRFPDLPRKRAKWVARLPRASRLAIPAAEEALRSASLLGPDGRSQHAWLEMVCSTTACGMELGEAFLRQAWAGAGPRGQFARISRYQTQQQVADLQEYLGFRGPMTLIANACASGASALGHAADLIRGGFADLVLAGGYDALCELVYTGFDCLQALSPSRCRPFDRDRDGVALGEAAAFLVLESEEHATERGAQIHAHLAGYGHSTDLYHHTQPDPTGAALAKAIRMALSDAAMGPGEIDYLNAHGTATLANDRAEIAAYQSVFGESLPQVRVSSTKSAIGHVLGAAGAIEAIFAIRALQTAILPPQLHLTNPEPAIAHALVHAGDRGTGGAVLSVNLGFGGSNAALIFTKP
jgi:3-oxoacyl-[acyl-carrier-protein] synthase II